MNLPYFLSILLVISVHLIIQFILKYLGHAAAPRVSLMTPSGFCSWKNKQIIAISRQ